MLPHRRPAAYNRETHPTTPPPITPPSSSALSARLGARKKKAGNAPSRTGDKYRPGRGRHFGGNGMLPPGLQFAALDTDLAKPALFVQPDGGGVTRSQMWHNGEEISSRYNANPHSAYQRRPLFEPSASKVHPSGKKRKGLYVPVLWFIDDLTPYKAGARPK
ncbi:hypothetical protein SCAR479_07575 [Seiridium cardinale]|uniref:Uncharacterized protein n=1 Tax=Seiridium cardinale TaxID=138064 RepID=A0ABR2XPN1_9PEZI